MSSIISIFYLYDPWLFHFFRMAFFVGGISIIILAYRIIKGKQTQGIIIPLDSLLVIIGLILLSSLPILINRTTEYGVIIMYIKTLILFILGIAIYNLFYRSEIAKQQVIRDLNIGIIVQSIIGFLCLAGISLMIDFALSTNVVMPRFYHSEQEYRLYNLTSMAFFQLSLFYLLLMHFLLAYNEKYNTISSVFIFLLLFIGLISGRTFLILSLFSLVIYFKWRYLPALCLFALICLFLALNYTENKYVLHALEPLINILKAEQISEFSQISTSSENLVKNHLYLPTLKQMLLGDGYYYTADGRYYGATDSGFIRQILYGGIGYLLVCFLFMFYFVKRIAQIWFEQSWKFTLSTLILLSILHIKADTYAFPGIMLVLLMFLSLFGNQGKQIVLFQFKGKGNV